MKLIIDEEEYRHIYLLRKPVLGRRELIPEYKVEISPDFYERYQEVMRQFWDLQTELAKINES